MKPYLLLLSLFFIACSPEHQKIKPPPISLDTTSINISPHTTPITKQEITDNVEPISSIIETFLEKVRDSPYEKIVYSDSSNQKVHYLDFFPRESSPNITLYTIPKATTYKSVKYAHIFLTSIEYKTDAIAKEAFQTLKEKSKLIIAPAAKGSLDESEKYEIMLDVSPYPGSFLVQKANFILSLKKSCGGNKLLFSFKEYENLFLESLDLIDSGIEVIKSDCGDSQFRIEKI